MYNHVKKKFILLNHNRWIYTGPFVLAVDCYSSISFVVTTYINRIAEKYDNIQQPNIALVFHMFFWWIYDDIYLQVFYCKIELFVIYSEYEISTVRKHELSTKCDLSTITFIKMIYAYTKLRFLTYLRNVKIFQIILISWRKTS